MAKNVRAAIEADEALSAEVAEHPDRLKAVEDMAASMANMVKYAADPGVMALWAKVQAKMRASSGSGAGPSSSAHGGGLKVSIKTLSGKTVQINADWADTVSSLKARLIQVEGKSGNSSNLPRNFKLCKASGVQLEVMEEGQSLRASGFIEGSTIFARREQHAAWGEYATCWEVGRPSPVEHAMVEA
mmetsp:Transcript_89708/g.187372  ORF Transcript_89708/g.187372 Transcript_89708/m.187372 type:complete len:187 (+) Transcript_89708:219-779(+)|eukprot:CAMPEP_0206452228 /NCGR_PEP_ID=MMETSP0324_2-20121206/19826_1 /ASSEMBLY_ACC=CAM_ASM_000836 /TAXON_ID=2866 /ORGANISM="Crypthecodinium cohnii, Strain Seligo" /LENGTH=186 /DNA_ID=CAMNT_0053922289 /DNA_START=119 /DNA_END=679 /DNA_ORIENTATION=+